MVCLMCLVPLFLVPILNILPLLIDVIMGKVYGLLGWEYRKPVRAPPACPYNPAANKSVDGQGLAQQPKPVSEPVGVIDDSKTE